MEVFPTAERLEVFANERGDITMLQEDSLGNDPAIIVIPLAFVGAVIKALRTAKKDAES